MSWLFEDPTTILVAGVLIEALLVVALVNSGQRAIVWAMAGVFALLCLGVLIERIVVTDREEISDTLDGVLTAIQANDIEGVLSCIDPQAASMRASVRTALASAHITEARVYDLEVAVNRHDEPPTAQAEFTGRVKGNYRGEAGAGEGMLLRKFTVDFRRAGDRWLMTGYQDRGAIVGRNDH
ncbi:MAG TPA: hypothetical protein VF278_07190 [Pirellulales bacterium]